MEVFIDYSQITYWYLSLMATVPALMIIGPGTDVLVGHKNHTRLNCVALVRTEKRKCLTQLDMGLIDIQLKSYWLNQINQ